MYNLIDLIGTYLSPTPVIIEAGACDGTDTLAMSKLWPHAKIYAFEPNLKSYNMLIQKVGSNKNIHTFNIALGSKNGFSDFYLCKQSHVKEEDDAGLTDGSCFSTFRQRVIQSKLDLMSLIAEIKAQGKKIYGIGAPSRASTLVNYVGLDDSIIDCVLEIQGSYKIGKMMPGTLIPVIEESKLFADQPAYALLFSWHIADELMPKLRAKGFKGKFLVPLPVPRVVDEA